MAAFWRENQAVLKDSEIGARHIGDEPRIQQKGGFLVKKIAFSVVVLSAIAAGALAAGTMGEHGIVPPQEIKWGPAPASIPAGAEAAVLYGDPGKDGLFALRLRMPAGYHIPPHTHPKPEIVTVISGTFRLGMGETASEDKGQALPAGSFFALEPGMAHYAFADEDTVIQLNSTGPWALTYVNPADDPRQQTQ
jgi:quercetin dioxygenase-like cupin family protein